MLWKSLIALCVIGAAVAEQTPVFLWGANSVAKPSLKTVSQSEFAEQLAALLEDHMVVAFEENGLSNKDFLCSNSQAQSCYAQLQGVSPKTYYTSVENPSEALRSVAAKREHNSIDASGKLTTPAKCAVGTALFVTFEDAATSREASLESHDTAIAAISKQFECKVAYLYLAAPSTAPVVQRRTRRDTAATTGGIIWKSTNQFQIFYTALLYNGNPITVTNLKLTNSSSTKLSVVMDTSLNDKPITFDVIYDGGYFSLSNLAYDGSKFRSSGVNAPTTFSYSCGNLTLESTAVNNMYNTLSFKSLQLQAPFDGSYKADFAFGDSWDCVGFVTPGILMGLFVVALLLVIMFVGVCWMMDINTMDRFDDPKGKTITINAAAE
ncbi:V-type proton ATPase subunit S1 [Drosophila teissieri]|uniref:V-type proton ATPase subunit S1 n=1 Tax=Drosophila teissieri TaxID=7243 RepID=UPI001CBA4CBB|nr:V-type proton ATPase subunit S1 [Drosophila teissieri]